MMRKKNATWNVVNVVHSCSDKMEAESCQKPESNGSKSDDEEEEILGSDNDEQEDPKDYCKGQFFRLITLLKWFKVL